MVPQGSCNNPSIAYGLGSVMGTEVIAIDLGLLNQFLSPEENH